MSFFSTDIQKWGLSLYTTRLRTRNLIKYRFIERFSATWIVVFIFISLAWLIICFDYSSVTLRHEELSSPFFNIGTITGSMLAIAFAFTSQLISRSSEALPARFYRIFARDTVIDISYALLGLITIVEFGIGITVNSDSRTLLLKIGLFLFLLSIIIL